jgi:hypothetical protein
MGNEPGQFPDFLVGRERQDESGRADRLQFHDFGDFDFAYLPLHPALFPWLLARILVAKPVATLGSSPKACFCEIRASVVSCPPDCGFPLPGAMDHLAAFRVIGPTQGGTSDAGTIDFTGKSRLFD